MIRIYNLYSELKRISIHRSQHKNWAASPPVSSQLSEWIQILSAD